MMNATSNPQTAAGQGRKNYRDVTALSTKLAAAAGEPLKEQVKRGVDELRKAN
jgi:hypothetical protein